MLANNQGFTRRVFFLINIANDLCFLCVFIIIFIFISTHSRACSRRLLGATIAPNLLPLVLKKIVLLEMFKNFFYFRNVKKKECHFFFSQKCATNNPPIPTVSNRPHVCIRK